MRTLIVSDLHLGVPGRHPQADGELCSLILRPGWDQIILLGDVFDLWSLPLRRIVKKHPTVIAILASVECPIIYVPGNHDDAFKGLAQLNTWCVSWPTYRFCSGGKWFTAVHGDEYDTFKSTASRAAAWISRLVDRIAAWFAGPGVSITREARVSFVERGPGREKFVRPLHERAVADLNCENLLIGHTHVPDSGQDINGTWVVGTGDFGPEHMTYVVVENGKAELHTIDP